MLGGVGDVLERSTSEEPEFMFLHFVDYASGGRFWEMIPITKSYNVRTLFKGLLKLE